MTARRLLSEDAGIYRTVRRESLVAHPEAYASTVAYLDGQDDTSLAKRLEEIPTFAAFEGDRPVALMGYVREPMSAMAHRAMLINVYVAEGFRGSGIGESLFAVLSDAAREDGIRQIELAVTVENDRAFGFYKRLGFHLVGTIPRGFRHGDRFVDEHLMVLALDA